MATESDGPREVVDRLGQAAEGWPTLMPVSATSLVNPLLNLAPLRRPFSLSPQVDPLSFQMHCHMVLGHFLKMLQGPVSRKGDRRISPQPMVSPECHNNMCNDITDMVP